jgi:putative ABC transport system permease protein
MMIRDYLKIASRNIIRDKGYSFINIAGLAIGLACCIVILLWVQDELSYDRFHQNARHLYRLNTRDSRNPDQIIVSSSFALAPRLKALYPEVVHYSRYWYYGSTVKYKNRSFKTHGRFCIVDPAFFEMFTFPFVKGDPETALTDRHSVVVSDSTAKKIFGDEDPLGKVLKVDDAADFTVTGVIKDAPHNSHLQFDYLSHIRLMPEERLTSQEFVGPSYVLLDKGASAEAFNRKIAHLYREIDAETTLQPYLQKFTDIHLYRWGRPGRIRYVYIFSIIALFILIIACINFMNLATARSIHRAREIGIRKVAGADRLDIIKQFLWEAIQSSFVALVLALVLVELLTPLFNSLSGKQMGSVLSGGGLVLSGIIGLTLLTGLLSGSYPALFLSAYQPVKVMRGDAGSGTKGAVFRAVLVVLQFSISVGLIICTIVIYVQLNYIKDKDLGFDRDFVLSIADNPALRQRLGQFRNELLKNGDIVSVTAASTLPNDVGQVMTINWQGNPNEDGIAMRYAAVDHDFIRTFGMEIVKGRDFSREFATDADEAYIVNETALKRMELENPIGKEIHFSTADGERYSHKGKIIGVVRDFHFRSLHEEIGPFVLRIYPPWFSYIFVKVRPGKVTAALAYIEKTANRMAPGHPFGIRFLDDAVNEMYRAEQQMGAIINAFAVLAILISCLGLFGLASFMTEKRTREIGIRKVLGSSVPAVVSLLSRSFSKWVLLANLVAWPLAFYAMNRWLQNFAYRTPIGIGVFILSALLALAIALFTVSYQSIKAATTNPITTLRSP